jgi:hypothetical protein
MVRTTLVEIQRVETTQIKTGSFRMMDTTRSPTEVRIDITSSIPICQIVCNMMTTNLNLKVLLSKRRALCYRQLWIMWHMFMISKTL